MYSMYFQNTYAGFYAILHVHITLQGVQLFMQRYVMDQMIFI